MRFEEDDSLIENGQLQEGKQVIDKSRRKFAKAGVAVPVILTLANRPAWGGGTGGVDECTISGFHSIGPNRTAYSGNIVTNPGPRPPKHYCDNPSQWPLSKCKPHSSKHETGGTLEGGSGCRRDRTAPNSWTSNRNDTQKGQWNLNAVWTKSTQAPKTKSELRSNGQNDYATLKRNEATYGYYIFSDTALGPTTNANKTLNDCIKELDQGTDIGLDNCMAWLFVNACDGKHVVGSSLSDVQACFQAVKTGGKYKVGAVDCSAQDIIDFCHHLIADGCTA
ncbi:MULTISPECIES: hypothetical protein [Methylomonas]|uniref:Uncharacterized protein n=1 Tax=Methylomonas koyamae TaxID=702114 RepID=A0A177P9Z1_9GAMM|nr:hypothetical protein [Methylomonas koyamae]OAI26130.1 hypothetical protein A1355_19265 [Methylomonas koyamae]